MHPRRNILLITTDQQRADHLGCYGNAIVRTPHIDRLAAGGRRFDRFYVATPICMPNRATMMTGRMPSVHGLHCNGLPLHLQSNTMGELLRSAGYITAAIGKVHLQNMTGRPAAMPRGDDDSDLTRPDASLDDSIIDRWRGGPYEQESLTSWRRRGHAISTPYYGFDHVELCTMHGDMVHGDYFHWLADRVPDAEALRGPHNALPDDRISVPQGYRTRVPEELYPTRYVQDRTIAHLETVAREDTPFFLHCSFTDPHHPFTPPGRYWDMYDPAGIPIPPTCAAPDLSHPVVRMIHELREQGNANTLGTTPFATSPREVQEAIALTYGMITMIDDAVGAVLATLDRLGLRKSTTVIFTSDHGDFMGDHGLMLKASLHYDGLVRVPMIWNSPGVVSPGAPTRSLCSALDLAPSILAHVGLAGFWGMQGRSMLPVLDDPQARLHGAVLIEEDGHEPLPGLDGPLRTRTIITDRHRLSIYDRIDRVDLFDLVADPNETRNLAGDPQHADIRSAMFQTLSRRMMELCDWSPFPTGRA